MCVKFSLSPALHLSVHFNSERMRAGFILLAMRCMSEATRCSCAILVAHAGWQVVRPRSCHASHIIALLSPHPSPNSMSELRAEYPASSLRRPLIATFLFSSLPKICWPRRRNTYLSSHRGIPAPGLRGPHLPIQPRWEAFCTRSAVRVRPLAIPYR
jgi:hypothetical protein